MSKFNTTSMQFTSRMSIKKGDSYFTFEATLQKQCDPEIAKDITEEELAEIKDQLWEEVNAEVDKQAIALEKYLKQK